jgi:predicted DNA-binding transcriptional regulator AlpA
MPGVMSPISQATGRRFLTQAAVARLLGVSTRDVWRMAKAGLLPRPFCAGGGTYLFPAAGAADAIEELRVK